MKTKQGLGCVVRIVALLGSLAPLLLACTAGAPPPPPTAAPLPGSVQLNQHSLNDYVGGGGTGTLFFDGTRYHFAISGLGVDGSAVAVMQATGDVSHLDAIGRFPGAYRLAPAGQSGSDMWLRNQNGVMLHLIAPPGSRMPPLDDDAVQIRMDQ